MKKIIIIITLIISTNVLSVGQDGTGKYIQVCTKIGGDGTENKIGGDGTENKVGNDGISYKTYCQIIPAK